MCALLVCSGIIGSLVAAGADGGAPRAWTARAGVAAAAAASRRRGRG
jgi:hypothetical protein